MFRQLQITSALQINRKYAYNKSQVDDETFCAAYFSNSGSANTTIAGGLLQNKLTPTST
jgi:hypothetical protein